jgi:hypothetical protein
MVNFVKIWEFPILSNYIVITQNRNIYKEDNINNIRIKHKEFNSLLFKQNPETNRIKKYKIKNGNKRTNKTKIQRAI